MAKFFAIRNLEMVVVTKPLAIIGQAALASQRYKAEQACHNVGARGIRFWRLQIGLPTLEKVG